MDANAQAEHVRPMIRYLPWRLLHTGSGEGTRAGALSASALLQLRMADNIPIGFKSCFSGRRS